MDKHPDDLLTGDGDPFKGDPNFMASPARGSGGDSGVHAAAAPAVYLTDQSEDRHPARRGAPLPVYPEQAGVRVCRRR